jgi:putative nucleotidyltransferase with HDIG domain
VAILGASVAWVVLAGSEHLSDPLTYVLLASALLSEFLGVRFAARLFVAGWDWCYLLAIVFLDARAALLIAWATYVIAWVVQRQRPVALLVNPATVGPPILIAGAVFSAVGASATGAGGSSPEFWIAVAAATVTALLLQLGLAAWLIGILDGVAPGQMLRSMRIMLPSFGFQALFAIAIAGVYDQFGTQAMVLAVVLVAAFAYMARLVMVSRERTRQYANLSWGILSGLIRTLDVRDSRAARHCAAVARFSRDIARAEGLSPRDQELAHTAGLLHDIGKFALSDRVMDGSTDLTDDDWQGIRRHPSIGAELLKDIGVYGPVAEIVGAHHERMDGRGYPRRLPGDEIPPIARIVAVAEVYDTLTAPDTYRTPMNSFEALNELRRVAGTQLDAHFVEVLAAVLAGQGTAYRHADEADFDVELDIQRRMNEAAAT